MARSNILIYLLRKDLRVADNPVFHHLATSDHGFTHMLPVYVFSAQQMEVKGFLKPGASNPYPEARSPVGGFYRCGPYRAKFIAETVWNLRESLESLGSGLLLRVGSPGDVVKDIIEQLHAKKLQVGAVYMTSEEGDEEQRDEETVRGVCQGHNTEFKHWVDEKYFVDDRDLKVTPDDLPNIFTSWQKSIEPLRSVPRPTVPKPNAGSLPPLLDATSIPPQHGTFEMPDSYAELEKTLVDPVKIFLDPMPDPNAGQGPSGHPFKGGEAAAHERLRHLLTGGHIANYHATRNGLLGTDYSTKLSAYLALGSITARQIHHSMLQYEDGEDSSLKDVEGFGKGENEGTRSLRYELVWRDYMRLCTRKFGSKLFALSGFKGKEGYAEGEERTKWKTAHTGKAVSGDHESQPLEVGNLLERFFRGTTGMGLIDASQRELLFTGYTSNRARQNVASFLAKHLEIDWRYGAEWYEMLLIDYDVSSNWANWQYNSGVGNDPRGTARIFNPVKQAFEYDKEGAFVRAWVPELAEVESLENVFQAWTMPPEERERVGLADNEIVTDPVKKIKFDPANRPPKRRGRRGGGGGGGGGGGRGGGTGGHHRGSQGRRHGGHASHEDGQMDYQHSTHQGFARGGGYSGGGQGMNHFFGGAPMQGYVGGHQPFRGRGGPGYSGYRGRGGPGRGPPGGRGRGFYGTSAANQPAIVPQQPAQPQHGGDVPPSGADTASGN